jgi:hypothetical protein
MTAPRYNVSFRTVNGQKGPREYSTPTVVRVYDAEAFLGYAVFGTPYGYVHTPLGSMKLFSRRASAYAVAVEYTDGTRGL